ncbi:hypothetical protein [Isoptericola sp. NPDC057391]|uniref:hypothetical protein n=1 Tax=Isoptericola sp. NPDC057391 TaxID=3346117 RepID=UPI003625B5C2
MTTEPTRIGAAASVFTNRRRTTPPAPDTNDAGRGTRDRHETRRDPDARVFNDAVVYWAFRQDDLPSDRRIGAGNVKVVLAALATFADWRGITNVSPRTVAEACALTTRDVRNALDLLEGSGHVVVVGAKRSGRAAERLIGPSRTEELPIYRTSRDTPRGSLSTTSRDNPQGSLSQPRGEPRGKPCGEPRGISRTELNRTEQKTHARPCAHGRDATTCPHCPGGRLAYLEDGPDSAGLDAPPGWS